MVTINYNGSIWYGEFALTPMNINNHVFSLSLISSMALSMLIEKHVEMPCVPYHYSPADANPILTDQSWSKLMASTLAYALGGERRL